MYNSHYFVEVTVKERQKQLLEEADRLNLLEVIKSSKSKNRRRKLKSISKHFKDLAAFRLRKKMIH